MSTPPPVPVDTGIRSAVLRMVLYFDVFRHPLALGEVVRLVAPEREDAVVRACRGLQQEGLVVADGRYLFRPGMGWTVPRRQKRAQRAERMWPNARRAARILSQIPFVRGILVTGSLSKNSIAEDGDVDFMLLIEPGHVWLTKTLLQAARRPLPLQVRECFCTNYLLDTEHLQIDDRNIFTAIELVTAVPMMGRETCGALLAANRWVDHFVPGMAWAEQRIANLAVQSPSPTQAILEKSLQPLIAAGLEQRAMSFWNRYWNRKYDWLSSEQRSQSFKRRPELATNHLHDFQRYVRQEVNRAYAELGIEESFWFDEPASPPSRRAGARVGAIGK